MSSELLNAYCLPQALSVAELLKWSHTPKRPGSRKFTIPPSDWLSKHEPSTTKIPIEELLLPPTRVCQSLEGLLQKAEGEGVCSVQHPTREGTYLPLWVVPVWKGADEMLRMQQNWRLRLVWIDRTAKAERWTEDLLKTAKASVLRAPWMSGFEVLQRGMVSVAHLAQVLLSDSWLDDEVIDCLGDVFHTEEAKKRISEDDTNPILIASAHLCPCLANAQSGITHHYGQKLAAGSVTNLLFPCNMNNLHWIPVEVDVTRMSINLGDSKPKVSHQYMPALLDDLRTWLASILPGRTWTVNAAALETGLQQDTSSCGIATVNAIERRILPDALKWSPQAPGKARARYFI